MERREGINIESVYPLSYMQEGMLFHEIRAPGSGINTEQVVCELRETLDVKALQRAWQRVVERHAIFRSSLHWVGYSKPVQKVHRHVNIPWEFKDWSELSDEDQKSRLCTFLEADCKLGLDISQAPVMRLSLFKLREQDYRLIWSFNHVLVDARSFTLVLAEVFTFYEAFREGQNLELQPPRPYEEYVHWLRKHDLKESETFWRNQLKGFTAPTPLCPRQWDMENGNEMVCGKVESRLSSKVTQKVMDVAAQNELTLNTVVQGAWALLLSRYSREDDVVFGVVRACRRSSIEGADSIVGLFINTLPMRIRVSTESSLIPWLKDLRAQHVRLRDYEHCPLIEVQKWSELPHATPLFESIVVFENYDLNTKLRSQGGEWAHREFKLLELTKFPITLYAYGGEELKLEIGYQEGRCDKGTASWLLEHFEAVLEGMAASPHRCLAELPLLTAADRKKLLEWNLTHKPFPENATIHQLFEAQAEQTPDSVALVFEGRSITYQELNTRANQLASYLRRAGVGPDVLVGICVERSIEMVIGLLGILKAGGAYVPLDPAYPPERLAFMISDTQMSVIVLQERFLSLLPEQKLQVVFLDRDRDKLVSEPEESVQSGVKADHLAYVIYTSGSTGKPKGVMIEHRNVSNFFVGMDACIEYDSGSTWLAVTSPSFDISVLEIFWTLARGFRVVIYSGEENNLSQSSHGFQEADGDVQSIPELIMRYKVTHFQCTPSMASMLMLDERVGAAFGRLRKVLIGGEAFPATLAGQLQKVVTGDILNMYGPTETTVWSTTYKLNRDEQGNIPIGRPIANTQIYIVDENLQPVPVGVPGQLVIGGAGVVRGYLHRAELTAERFIRNPFSSNPESPLYLTGDLARYLPDGNIEFMGRMDHQVKIRGHRIELGEIEAVLNDHPAIYESVVIAREDVPGQKRLVAYVIPREEGDLRLNDLRDYAKEKLPGYMVPAHVVKLKAFPQTPNKKIDRKALPPPEKDRLEWVVDVEPPQTDIEEAIAALWAEALGVNQVGRNENFFDLGGDSVSACGVILSIQQTCKMDLPMQTIFRHPTVAALAKKLEEAFEKEVERRVEAKESTEGTTEAKKGVLSLSRVEQTLMGIWQELLGRNDIHVDDDFFKLGGNSLRAIEAVFRIHESFGIELPLGAFFENPTIASMAALMTKDTKARARKEDSTVSQEPEVELRRLLESKPEDRYTPFPLTDVQEAYWIGRGSSYEMGNVACHIYWEAETDGLDMARYERTWQRLIDRHEMLRVVFLSDGRQQILERTPPYRIKVEDLSGMSTGSMQGVLAAIRDELSHQVLPSDRWPLFDIRASKLSKHRTRLHFSFDLLIADAWSLQVLQRELAELYHTPEHILPPLNISFRDYVLAVSKLRPSSLFQRSLAYWEARSKTLPPAPELPFVKNLASIEKPRFTRRQDRLEPEFWEALQHRAAEAGLTVNALLFAAYADVLSVWNKRSHFMINLTLFNRLPIHPEVDGLVGDFTSTTLLGVDMFSANTFQEFARKLSNQLWKDLDHRYVSGVEVLRKLARDPQDPLRGGAPVVFTSTVGLTSQERYPCFLPGQGEVIYRITQTPQVWLDQIVYDEGGRLIFNWDVVDDLFPPGMVDDMFQSYGSHLRRLAKEDGAWLESREERLEKLLPSWQLQQRKSVNATSAPLSNELLHVLFEKQAQQNPQQVAVISQDRALSYAELEKLSRSLGRQLRGLGAKPNSLVAIVMKKGWEQVVAALGTLFSGAAYLPIDAALPKERLWYILEHGKVEFILTQSGLDETLEWPGGLKRICVDREESIPVDDRPLDPVQRQEDLAYVIYTSGSTGLPKGVMIDHRGAVNTLLDINRRFGVGPNDRVLALSSLSFDLSVYDIFGILAAGGTLVMPEQADTRDPSRWAQLIARENVTIWNSVPALMELLVEYVASRSSLRSSSLRLVMMSGDWIPVTLPDQIKTHLGEIQIISLGGATEASIWSILYPIEKGDPNWKSIPYGKPMINQQFYVLNEALAPCPAWVPGQLYIGGIGVAKGYWRDVEKTQTSFITHPRTGERLYRTGDLGRYLPDGNIEFLGREDFQVQIQGYRVELGEIEAALSQHPAVRTAVVTAVGELQGNKGLAAYVVPEQRAALTTPQLRQFLQQKLPEYMIPSAFVMLEQLPLTPNGKVDRKSLPDPSQVYRESFQAPPTEETNLTERIGRFVTSILGTHPIAPDANLLHLGATSIHMIRIANLLEKELNFRPKMDEVYRLPTVLGLAKSYKQHLQQNQTANEASEQVLEPTAKSILTGFELLLDPEEREAFKNKEPGVRKNDDGRPSIEFNRAEPDDTLKQAFSERRSTRQFSSESIPIAQFSELLSCLRQVRLDGKPKYRYASAGGLYPVQTYLYIKPGRVETLDAGIYYYHPGDHRLILLSENGHVDPGIYDWIINRPIFEEAAFSIFFVAQLSAIAPMYGERSMHYATIEAGLMAQLLETSAPACGIGLCQIGDLDFKRIRDLFALDQSHVLVHSLLGGLADTRLPDRWSSFREVDFGAVAGDGDWERGDL